MKTRTTKAPKLPVIPEHDIQANFFREANYEFRNDPTWMPALFYAVLHGAWIAGEGRRKSALIAKYKAEGWRRGIADIHLDQPRGPYNKLALEFKRADKRNTKNGALSDEQIVYLNAIALYAMVRVCYTVEEALEALRVYMQFPVYHPSGMKENGVIVFHSQFKHDIELCEVCKSLGGK